MEGRTSPEGRKARRWEGRSVVVKNFEDVALERKGVLYSVLFESLEQKLLN